MVQVTELVTVMVCRLSILAHSRGASPRNVIVITDKELNFPDAFKRFGSVCQCGAFVAQ